MSRANFGADDIMDAPADILSATNKQVSAISGTAATYDGHPGSFEIDGDHACTHAHVLSDGRVDVGIFLKETIAHALRVAMHHEKKSHSSQFKHKQPASEAFREIPRLNIVIQIVGSRGDVQPFIALARVLVKTPYNHRVRICTHTLFKDFVEENGLEFFSIGGDPAQLMAYMVNNPGLIPGMDSIRAGDIRRRRAGVAENLQNAWRSCIEPSASKGTASEGMSPPGRTFVADAIIANPPSFGHLHCAEKLHIPLHLMFTMPWTPTQAFPHPLANIKASNVDRGVSNFLSYPLMDLITWQGIGDIINNFRIKTLQLEPISAIWAGGLVSRLQVPFTYCWSEALIPKPKDWGPNINVAGYFFLEGAKTYKPPKELTDFLNAGQPPVYIGFGSIVVDDPAALTKLILTAVKTCAIRAVVLRGWSELGSGNMPEGIYLLENVPHDWLFPRVSAVVHHGGAGTTAIGIASGKPTVVVPFFGDQGFWGAMIHRAGAGPEPIPFKHMTAETLTRSIQSALQPETLSRAEELANQIHNENGKEKGARIVCEAIGTEQMRCMLDPRRYAVWHVKGTKLRLSAFAATVIVKEHLIQERDLQLIQHKHWDIDEGPQGPLSGCIVALVGSLSDLMLGIGHLSHSIVKASVHKIQNPFPLSVSQTRDKSNRAAVSNEPNHQPESSETTEKHVRPKSSSGKDAPTRVRKRWRKACTGTENLQPCRGKVNISSEPLYNEGDVPSSVYLNRKSKAKERQRMLESYYERDPPGVSTKEYLVDVLDTTGKISLVIIKLPMEITYNIARGFHNAPGVILGDETVRKQYSITGIPSGLIAAGKEFTLGFYDGITGIIIHPYMGAMNDGTEGFFKGVVRGFGGLFFKTQAAVWAVPGYSFKGIHREFRKLKGPGIHTYVRHTKIVQGLREFNASGLKEKATMLTRWKNLSAPLKRKGTR